MQRSFVQHRKEAEPDLTPGPSATRVERPASPTKVLGVSQRDVGVALGTQQTTSRINPAEPYPPPLRQLQALSLEQKPDRPPTERPNHPKTQEGIAAKHGSEEKGNRMEDGDAPSPMNVEPQLDWWSEGDTDEYRPSSSEEESTTSDGTSESALSIAGVRGREGKEKERVQDREGRQQERVQGQRLESREGKGKERPPPVKAEHVDDSGVEEFVRPCERCAEMERMCLKFHGDGAKTRVKACESCHNGKKKCSHAKRGRPKASKREQRSESEDEEPATKRVKMEDVVAGPSRKRGRPKLTEEQKQKNREARKAATKSTPRRTVNSKAVVESNDEATPPPVNMPAEQWIGK